MGRSCPYCTMWADGFNGVLDHLEDRAAFALVSPDTPLAQRKFAGSRGWKFKMVLEQGDQFFQGHGVRGRRGKPRAWSVSVSPDKRRAYLSSVKGRIRPRRRVLHSLALFRPAPRWQQRMGAEIPLLVIGNVHQVQDDFHRSPTALTMMSSSICAPRHGRRCYHQAGPVCPYSQSPQPALLSRDCSQPLSRL